MASFEKKQGAPRQLLIAAAEQSIAGFKYKKRPAMERDRRATGLHARAQWEGKIGNLMLFRRFIKLVPWFADSP